MLSELTTGQRQAAMVFLALFAFGGLFVAGFGGADPIAGHGWLVLAIALLSLFAVLTRYFDPEPAADRSGAYYDAPVKAGIIIAMIWAVAGMFVGDWVAWLLVNPNLTFVEEAWASFGRLRPVHTTAVIFGFGGNALIATSFYVVQRTCRTRLAGHLSPLFVLWGYNLFCLLAVTGYLWGINQSKEYA